MPGLCAKGKYVFLFFFFFTFVYLLECGEQMNERTHIMVQLFDFVIGAYYRYFPGSAYRLQYIVRTALLPIT